MNPKALGSTFTALTLLGAVSAAETGLDPAQRFSPLIVGTPPPENLDLRFESKVVSKYVDQGAVLNDDASLTAKVSGRIWGLGAQIDAAMALGGDSRDLHDTAFPDVIALGIKVDYLAEFEFAQGVPLVTVNPYYEYRTYPVQPSRYSDGELNRAKQMQRWLGVDAWAGIPYEGWQGIEFGAGLAFNTAPDSQEVRGGIGSRQFIQVDGFDVALHQILGFGNSGYRRHIVGGDGDNSGFTTFSVGGTVTKALPYREWFVSGSAGVAWWIDPDDRNAQGNRDSAIITLSMGVEWIPNH